MKRWIFAAIFVGLLVGCQSAPPSDPPESAAHEHESDGGTGEIVLPAEMVAELGVECAPIEKRRLHELVRFPGTILPDPAREAFVGSLISGRVVAVLVGEGDEVKKGEPLCRIESPEIGAAQAQFIRALAQYRLAVKDFDRHTKLREDDITSEKSYLEKEAGKISAQAELAAAERALRSIGFDQQEIDLLRTDVKASSVLTIRSPIDGTVVQRNVRMGQRIEPDLNLFHVVDLRRLWVKFALYEKDLGIVRPGTRVTAFLQTDSEQRFIGRIVRIGREIQPETRQVFCYAEIDNRSRKLLPNQFVTCEIQAGMTAEPVLAVPVDAVIKDNDGDFLVYVEHEPNHFLPRPVEIGTRCAHWCEIVSGISEGEKVVLKGAFFIKSEVAKGSFGHGHVH